MSAKYSKAPWHLVLYVGHEPKNDFPGQIVADDKAVVFAGPFSFRALRGKNAAQALANARLMAASPTLLAACELARRALHSKTCRCSACKTIDAAIAAAKGRKK